MFYRRPLPEGLIPFSSPLGRDLFRESLQAGDMEGYFPLAEQFHTQAEPAFCGLASLVVILNALAIDPGRLWRGPWRWFSEELLDCCQPLEQVRARGLTLDDFACLARCNGARVELRRPAAASLEDLRRDLHASCRSAEGPHLVAAYDRGVLGQTGSGHFSPVAGLHAGRDLALVLDVARFKYPPHWVPLSLLFAAMEPHDPDTGQPRGYLLLRRAPGPAGALCAVSCKEVPLGELLARLRGALAVAAAALTPEDAIAAALSALPEAAADLIALRAEALAGQTAIEHQALLSDIETGLRQAGLYHLVARALAQVPHEGPMLARLSGRALPPAEILTLLLLALPDDVAAAWPPVLAAQMEVLRAGDALPAPLRAEVTRLREQLTELERRCCGAGS
jgi:glutathione gamma-glutamylcysteinyltransferase